MLIDKTGRTTLVVTPAWDGERAAELSRTDETLGCDDLAEGIEKVLAKNKIDRTKVVTVAVPIWAFLPVASVLRHPRKS